METKAVKRNVGGGKRDLPLRAQINEASFDIYNIYWIEYGFNLLNFKIWF
jgi:hypothetical protein